jgi:hypothetical protein
MLRLRLRLLHGWSRCVSSSRRRSSSSSHSSRWPAKQQGQSQQLPQSHRLGGGLLLALTRLQLPQLPPHRCRRLQQAPPQQRRVQA